MDFINRVDAKDVNKLQLEGLTKAGVFDEFDTDRSKIFNSIPKIIQQIKNINLDKNNNQSNLFDETENFKDEFEFAISEPWSQKELLSEEFKALGFYISNHPLSEFKDILNQLDIISYDQFYNNNAKDGTVAGTIMSIQEKKSAKGTPYAIIKFSDEKGEFELFVFAETLINNRSQLKESESFVLSLQKDNIVGNDTKKRVNIKKISSLYEVINKPYSKVTIELNENFNLDEIKKILSKNGSTSINLIIKDRKQTASYFLKNNRKFDLKDLKALKAKKYVEKITF